MLIKATVNIFADVDGEYDPDYETVLKNRIAHELVSFNNLAIELGEDCMVFLKPSIDNIEIITTEET